MDSYLSQTAQSSHVSESRPSVAIVGAGIAGLTCARQLMDVGLEVTVFEKSRGVGGRMATRRTDSEARFDHGAQYFTVRDERFREAVDDWVRAGVVALWDGRICTLNHGLATPKDRQKERFVGTPGMNGVCRHLADGVEIELRVRVDSVTPTAGGWRIVDDIGTDWGVFDYFLTTAPAPQSADLLAETPHLQHVARSVPMQGCWAVMLALENPLDVDFDGAFVEDSPLSWLARNSAKPQRSSAPDCWVLHASPEWTTSHLEHTPEQVEPLLLEAFWEATGHHVVNANFCSVHRWRYAIPPQPLARTYLFDPDAHIGAAGDWCNGPRIEGAFLSGSELASAVAKDVATKRVGQQV